MLYSDKFELYNGPLSLPIQEGIEEIKQFFTILEIKVLRYDEYSIAIPVEFKVTLPSFGSIGGIDIREKEPCIIRIALKTYPFHCPLVISDRMDFPRKFLGHLYATKGDDKPGGFCLVRNDLHEWFSNKKLTDLLHVMEEWFYKAGIDKLNEDGNEFDPTRLERFSGYHIYKYDKLQEVVSMNQRFLPDHPFSLMLCCVYWNKEDLTYKTLSPILFVQLKNMQEFIKKMNENAEENNATKLLVTLVVWDENNAVDGNYSTSLPDTYGALKVYFQVRGINIDPILAFYIKSGLQYTNGIPIIHAIKRPKKMIGYDGNHEFINFTILASNFKINNFPDEAQVNNQFHIEPFSKEAATKLTGENRNADTLYIGAGSLGSKIFMHDVRSGKMRIGVVDHDDFLPHNLARHELFNSHIGNKKADALLKEAKDFFPLDKKLNFISYPYRANLLSNDILKAYNWIVDSTASNAVQNWLTEKKIQGNINIARCELVDSGKLGLLYIEGSSRNPRIDDLVNLTYYQAVCNPLLQTWRKNDSKSEKINLDIGLGCSSPTTVMPDDTISMHASVFSKLLHNEKSRQTFGENGLLFRSFFQTEAIPGLSTQYEIIKPFDIYNCEAGSGWEVRLPHGLKEKFFALCKHKGNIETGGAVIGVSNYKTKTIHIFEIIVEPQDSKGSCTGFTRGIQGLPKYVDKIKEITGQIIGYIGEWHTHPMDMERLSDLDIQTIAKLQKMNRKVPIPTCAIIVTNHKILPFIYE